MKVRIFALIILIATISSCADKIKYTYVDQFKNENHPQIVYWFFTPDMCENDKYLATLDTLSKNSLFDFIFISAREGCDFYDVAKMKPIFEKLVAKAHQKGLKIGLQLWNDPGKISEANCQRTLTEGEILLDDEGNGSFTTVANQIRPKNFYKTEEIRSYKTELFRALAFKKAGDGYYDPATLKDISIFCEKTSSTNSGSATFKIHAGRRMAGYTVYMLAQHFYNHADMFSYASSTFTSILEKYSDIPFDGTGLDEFGYMRITPPWEMKPGMVFSERFYSPKMGELLQKKANASPEILFLHTRYCPKDSCQIRVKAINDYMEVLRKGPLSVENQFYKASKKIFGKDCFIGVHNTFHNSLTGDEVWVTGANWWTIDRDYGQTDELSVLPTQMGIALTNRKNVLYNMYYHPSPDTICQKAITDLRYGIRTHYHAINDKHWGIGLESPLFLRKVEKIEQAARLLNRFNPPLPEVKLLVIFGSEALCNWYPNVSARGSYDINNKLSIEEKAVAIQKAGYMNALVPSDLIENGKLQLNNNKKPEINGRDFDAIVYLYPQYARERTLRFLEDYVNNGGKLMLEGEAEFNFEGQNIRNRFKAIEKKATVKQFDIQQLEKLDIRSNIIEGGCFAEDHTVVLTDYLSLVQQRPARFNVVLEGETYSGSYIGMLAMHSEKGKLSKITSLGLLELNRNSNTLLKFEKPQSFFYENKGGLKDFILVNSSEKIRPSVCHL